jgi:hypothetical protein
MNYGNDPHARTEIWADEKLDKGPYLLQLSACYNIIYMDHGLT